MSIIQHSTVTGVNLHGILAFTVATSTARDALAVTITDIGKVVRVTADESFYILTAASPAVWSLVGAPAVTAVANITGGTLGSIPYQSAPSTTALLSAGPAGYFLTSNGVSAAPSWQAYSYSLPAAISVDSVTAATSSLTLAAVNTDLGHGGHVVLEGGNGGGNHAGGNVSITAGSARNGGNVALTGGNGGVGPAGSVTLSGGVSGTGLGNVIINTSSTERLRVLPSGAWSVGPTGTDYGTAGQVLTSNGNAAPTWQVAGGFTGGTIGAITLPSITLGYAGGTPVAGTIQGASGTTAGINSASVYVKGGSQSGGGTSLGFGGSLYLVPGSGHADGYHGEVVVQAASGADRFRITNTGAWSVGAGGSAYGTAGQVLTSNGNAVPTWTTPTAASTTANNTYTKAQRGGVVALTAGLTVTADFNAANNFSLLTNQTFTMAFPTNVVAGQSGVIVITQDATGSRVVTWAAGWVAGDGATPILSTAANAVDYIYYYTESSSRIMVSATKNVR